jgi:hypothetical protein
MKILVKMPGLANQRGGTYEEWMTLSKREDL